MGYYGRISDARKARKLAAKRRHRLNQAMRRQAPGPWNAPYFVTTYIGVFMSRKTLAEMTQSTAMDADAPAAHDPSLNGRCPMLHDLLTVRVLPGGKRRATCTISIFAADGVFKASLNEKDRGLVLWAAADELGSLPDALEALLAETPIPWRRSAYSNGRGGGR